ncbi:MAG: hypothetical protein B7X48_09850 [Acidiphilium sp. 34-60-192]|nr:MAG: hypothetical protein B7X48_09850 [Acidiphilium sp. 34-60-192]
MDVLADATSLIAQNHRSALWITALLVLPRRWPRPGLAFDHAHHDGRIASLVSPHRVDLATQPVAQNERPSALSPA